MTFYVKSWEKIDTSILQICPPHLSDVAILPREIQKVIFNSIFHAYFWSERFARMALASERDK